ncbi:MAG: caspase family protein [Planctomycetes bacterium]|nr:caspase family protein [Planctomycetota bacterium]
MADRAALLIAVETYFEAGPPIPYAASDCAELHRALPAAGYNPAKCFLIAGTRTTKASIESHLRRLPKLVDKADSLLVLIVTRGFSQKGRGYLACADTITPDLAETSLAVADLLAALNKTKCKEISVLLDVDSFTLPGEVEPSGLDADELTNLFDASANCVGLLSCEPGERSFESATLRHGIWRHHLIEMFTGKSRTGVAKDGSLTAEALHEFLVDAVPRTLRRSYDSPEEQVPQRLGESKSESVIADLGKLLGPGSELLDPGRMKRVVFRAESNSKIKDLTGYRKSHNMPDRVNDWARKYVNRAAVADIKADLDNTFDMVREQFGYKRKDLDVSAERDGMGYIRTPDFEYSVSVTVNPDDLAEVIWQREIGRLSGPEFVRSTGFQAVFGSMFDRLVFEFAQPVDVADFVDQIEDSPPEGVKVGVASDANEAEIVLAGFAGKVVVTPESVVIQGRRGNSASLLEQFLAFLKKFTGLGEPKALPAAK